MFNMLKKFLIIKKFKKMIRLITRYVYSERYDLNYIIKILLNCAKDSDILLAYIATRLSTEKILPPSEADFDKALIDYYSIANKIIEPELKKLLFEEKRLEAEINLTQMNAYFELIKSAYKADKYSIDGLKYRALIAKKGPLTFEEHKKFENYSVELNDIQRKQKEYISEKENVESFEVAFQKIKENVANDIKENGVVSKEQLELERNELWKKMHEIMDKSDSKNQSSV